MGQNQCLGCDTWSQRLVKAGIDIDKLRDVAMRVERKPIANSCFCKLINCCGASPQWCATQILFFVFLIAHFLLLVFFTIRNTQDAWVPVLTNSADDTSRGGADFIALLASQAVAVFLYLCALVCHMESYYGHIIDVILPPEDPEPVNTETVEKDPLLTAGQSPCSPADVLFFML